MDEREKRKREREYKIQKKAVRKNEKWNSEI